MTDSELIEAVRNNADKGMALIAEKYSGYAYAIAREKLSAFSPADIDDAVQDIFVRLWQSIEKIDLERGSLKTYICIISKSVCIRKRDSLAKAQKNVPLDLISDYKADDKTVESELRKRELIDKLKALPKDDRSLIMQRYYFGLDHKEIARTLGISEAAARKRAERILKRLAQQIEEVS